MTRTEFTLMLDEVLNEFDCKIDGILYTSATSSCTFSKSFLFNACISSYRSSLHFSRVAFLP